MKKALVLLNFCMVLLMMSAVQSRAATFSYSQDFSGTNGTQPAGWIVDYGGLNIQSNTYRAPSTDAEHLSYYNGTGSNLWSNYTASLWVSTTMSWTAGGSNANYTDMMGLAFRVQDSDHYYFVALRKLKNMYDGRLCIYRVTPEGSTLIGSVKSKYALNTYYQNKWYRLTIELNGSQITARFVEKFYEWDNLGEVSVTDSAYSNGTVGIYSISHNDGTGAYHFGDDLAASGTNIEHCSDVLGQYRPAGDVSGDCKVNMADMRIFVQNWLNCIKPGDSNCANPWNN